MTNADIQQATPRIVAPGVMECGPYFEQHARGGYFIVGRRQIHWYEETTLRGDAFLLTRDEALNAALHDTTERE